MFSGRVSKGGWPRMPIRSKQWYTKASRLPNSFAKVSIGPPLTLLRNKIIGQRTDGDQNFKYLWVVLEAVLQPELNLSCAAQCGPGIPKYCAIQQVTVVGHVDTLVGVVEGIEEIGAELDLILAER